MGKLPQEKKKSPASRRKKFRIDTVRPPSSGPPSRRTLDPRHGSLRKNGTPRFSDAITKIGKFDRSFRRDAVF
jgi:hypothetical protein